MKRWILLLVLLSSWLGFAAGSEAVAPAWTAAHCTSKGESCPGGLEYPESICNTDPNVIMCEPFNMPNVVGCTGNCSPGTTHWYNPACVEDTFGFTYSAGLSHELASAHPAKPQGAMPSGAIPDSVWRTDWGDWVGGPSSQDAFDGHAATNCILRRPGGAYVNGFQPVAGQRIHIRMQHYFDADYVWSGGQGRTNKPDHYGFAYDGINGNCVDTKILAMYGPVNGTAFDPTNMGYDANLSTQCGGFRTNAEQGATGTNGGFRFADALQVRFGTVSCEFKAFPFVSADFSGTPGCARHGEYKYANITTFGADPNETPSACTVQYNCENPRIFRFNRGVWYTIEVAYIMPSTTGGADGGIEVWIDGTRIYSVNDLATCGSGGIASDCLGVGILSLLNYHNTNVDGTGTSSCGRWDCTPWRGGTVIDNLIMSTSYIGPPGGAVVHPSMKSNGRIQTFGGVRFFHEPMSE